MFLPRLTCGKLKYLKTYFQKSDNKIKSPPSFRDQSTISQLTRKELKHGKWYLLS
ncbi:hypothetical protein Hanom_Chr04g00344441 [Helianthus anomalus]